MLHCLSHSHFLKKEQYVDFTEGIVGLHYIAHSMDLLYCHYTALFRSSQITVFHSLSFLLLLFTSLVSKIPLIMTISLDFSLRLLSLSRFSTSEQFSFFQTSPILYPHINHLTLFKKWFLPVTHTLYSPAFMNIKAISASKMIIII